MQKEKFWKLSRGRGTAAALLAAVLVLFGSGAAQAAMPTSVIPIGRTAGIKMASDGVMVVRISAVQTAIGETHPAKQAGLQEGDLILTANGTAVSSNESLQKAVAAAGSKPVTLAVRRSAQNMELTVHPVQDTSGTYKIGVMVRDSMAGIGTITYVDPATGDYGSLGHGICDTDTGVLLPLKSGNVMESSVSGVTKGAVGAPGALQGEFNLQKDMGTVTANTNTGIFGVLTDDHYYKTLAAMPVAKRSEVKTGQAEIWSNVEGETVQRYTVEISKLFEESDDLGRCMLLRVTDPALLAKTGGIVQGMSGSPVVQNGKLIGAVTHVLVNDPTRGYAVFIEKMLAESAQEKNLPG